MPDQDPTKNTKLNLSLNYKWISLALLAVVLVMLILWKPWQSTQQEDRTVSVTGTAKVKAEPDQFVFFPTYEFKNADKTQALADMSAKSNEIVAGLKRLGVADKDIKNSSSGYEKYGYPEVVRDGDALTYQLSLTITVANREMAQKVQEYLVSTAPSGQVTPHGQFTDEKRKELEDKAREEANKDARIKAEKSAKSLGYKIGRVKSVNDGAGFQIEPLMHEGRAAQLDASSAQPLTLQPGQEEVYYSVTVVYYVR